MWDLRRYLFIKLLYWALGERGVWRREHAHICILSLSAGGNKLQCFFLHTLHDVHTTAHTVTHTTGRVLSLPFSSLLTCR